MRVALVNYSDTMGGSARAAYRIHQALLRTGVDSKMYVGTAFMGDQTVQTMDRRWSRYLSKCRHPLARLLTKAFGNPHGARQSPNIFPSQWQKRLNGSEEEVIHLHLMAEEMMSIAEIGRLREPLVWTLHDMWGFCGAEHHTEDFRWREGYSRQNRSTCESGLDLNRWTWKRKLKHWRRARHIVTPSRWLADCVQSSILMRDWPVFVVPNPIDTDSWTPIDKTQARKILRLPSDKRLLLFGATGGARDPNKGFHLLKAALDHLNGEIHGLELMVFGQLQPKEPARLGFPIHYAGYLHDDVSLRLFYSAADALVVPSRQESFGLVASEAHACGTPVVAFDVGGLKDIVDHGETGFLAKPFDPADLARGIKWVLGDSERQRLLGAQCRARAVERYAFPVVAEKYLQVYRTAACNAGK